MKERGDHLGDVDTHGMVLLKWIVKKLGVRVWFVMKWFRTCSSGRLLWPP